ncbi:MAG: STT3 domain-containing protein, partial [Desulfuromusa sp.]|nr:STT3 domain-containing protein [Desulfuromusa sp.]
MNKVQNFFSNYRACLLLFVGILIVYGLSYYQRQADYNNFWMENQQDYVAENVTLLTSLDSYYWLKMAREFDKGTIGKGLKNPTKGYPDLQILAIKDTPSLLAVLISFAKNFTADDYYLAGIFLVPILSGLFVFPLFFYFSRLGFGASAILGGLIGTFGHAYYDRTMMGRIDTDLLNTFFPLAIACFILPISREKTGRANILLAAGAGLMMYLFTWWYQQASFIFIYFLVLMVYLIFSRVRWKISVAALVVFLLLSGPEHVSQILESFMVFLKAYVSPPPTGGVAWPNILDTVAEAKVRSLQTRLNMLHGFNPLVYAGFIGLLYLCLRRFRQMIPLAPLLALGAWAMVGPNRFVMYLSPLIGVGAGVLLEELIRYIGGKAHLPKALVPVVSMVLFFVLFFSTATQTGFYAHAGPIVSASTVGAMLDIKRAVPRNSAMFTPFWEYGYTLMEVGDFATYHDGGLQGGMRTTLIAKAMTSNRQEEMVSLLAYLEDYGFNQLGSRIRREKLSGEQMMDLVFSYPGGFKGENVYVLYFEDMIVKFPPMSKFGTWDFEKRKSEMMDYVEIHCFSMVDNIMRCMDGT